MQIQIQHKYKYKYRYVAALTALYEEHNPKYGDIATELVIT